MKQQHVQPHITQLIQGTNIVFAHPGPPQLHITDITEDSSAVIPGSLFVARKGETNDGAAYIEQAISAGANAILTEHNRDLSQWVTQYPNTCFLTSTDIAYDTAILAERFFGNPSSTLDIIGITGTNGKTTLAHILWQLLTAPMQTNDTTPPIHIKCGLIGTIYIHDGEAKQPSTFTTPFAIELSRTLKRMCDNGCTHVVMEVSSHALAQQRTAAIQFKAAVFTNLTGDHLDYHHTMDAYCDAKSLLFTQIKPDGFAVVNGDDPHWKRIIRHANTNHIIRCSTKSTHADITAHIDNCNPNSTTISITGLPIDNPTDLHNIHIPLIGHHNVVNLMQATAVATTLYHTSNAFICKLLQSCTPPPGRLEIVSKPSEDITVLVDYAHTDDALHNVLRALRDILPLDGQLICVFGCGGDRDKNKRPRMAKVACDHADLVMITSDNPRTECPENIIKDIIKGIPTSFTNHYRTQTDRKTAIQMVIEDAKPNDIILIAGKGHEDYQIVGTTTLPFDDRLMARTALDRRYTKNQ